MRGKHHIKGGLPKEDDTSRESSNIHKSPRKPWPKNAREQENGRKFIRQLEAKNNIEMHGPKIE
jgi:hypothetical protein